ncbi:MAG TPA: hypothetical protein VKV18_03505 [Chthonomonas sp.]|uniref:hypothetical protein n=1 Tax=Chthonomonas sp. TaxID=2282153 RepID=UPI002B4B269E|nr:hypothetical protein [Chthonomonas sp.]HLI47744.1 hypothetical protein [Chthonomonas sp.]
MATYTTPETEEVRTPVIENPRKDAYWLAPTTTVVVLVIFVIYATIRAFMGRYFATYNEGENFPWLAPMRLQPHYWSPFYSPYIPVHLRIGAWPVSAALYVMILPLAFRLSCYFCRRVYYRAFFQDPGACAVRELFKHRRYTGETRWPNKIFNLHRYTFYIAVILVGFHWWHLYNAFFYTEAGQVHVGAGLGTLIFLIDTLALTLYTFSCHAFRHLIGGAVNWFSKSGWRYKSWRWVSWLNEYHGQFFWVSLVTVMCADLYVYLVASGVFTDPRFF